MALRTLRIEGDPILRKTARPVQAVTDRIREQLEDMLETMYAEGGVGLAGPQVGLLRRLVVVDVGEGAYKLINPEILSHSDDYELGVEGCLSVPSFNGTVSRPQWVQVRYLDEWGEEKTLEATDLFARCLCHEIDHLNGVLFRDKVEKVIDMEHPTEDQKAYLRTHHLLEDSEAEAEGSE